MLKTVEVPAIWDAMALVYKNILFKDSLAIQLPTSLKFIPIYRIVFSYQVTTKPIVTNLAVLWMDQYAILRQCANAGSSNWC